MKPPVKVQKIHKLSRINYVNLKLPNAYYGLNWFSLSIFQADVTHIQTSSVHFPAVPYHQKKSAHLRHEKFPLVFKLSTFSINSSYFFNLAFFFVIKIFRLNKLLRTLYIFNKHSSRCVTITTENRQIKVGDVFV